VFYYQARMGFLPNAIKLYLQTPWIGEHLFRLNNGIMRDERNSLSEHLKYRLALVARKIDGLLHLAPCLHAAAPLGLSGPAVGGDAGPGRPSRRARSGGDGIRA
jgi:hypothetical protein